MVGSAIGFIQSKRFARVAQDFLSRSIPPELGVRGTFEEFGIRLFPPAVSISRPQLQLEPRNLFALPADSVIRAERIDLRFRPVQVLTGKVQLDQVRIVGGDIELEMAPGARSPGPSRAGQGIKWDELVQVQVRGVALENTRLSLDWKESALKVVLDAEDVLLERDGEAAGAQLDLRAAVSSLLIREGKSEREIIDLRLAATIKPDRVDIERLSADFGTDEFEFLVSSSGTLSGSILDLSSLKADLSVEASGDFESLATWAGLVSSGSANRPGEALSGSLSFDGRLGADLMRLSETLVFDGRTVLKGGDVRGWRMDLAEISARFESQGRLSAGLLSIRSGKVALPGNSGRVELGSIQYKLGSRAALRVPMVLQQARLGALLGPYRETVGNLEAVWTGRADLELLDASGGPRLKLLSDLKAPSLKLYGKGVPPRAPLILEARNPVIRGESVIEPGKFTPKQLQLEFEKSRFVVGGGVSWRTVGKVLQTDWDLVAGGTADLSDLASLGGSKILGKGGLQARVHGPAAGLALDFDADLEGSGYIGLDFGKLRGRISLVEDFQKLVFHSVQAKSGTSPYIVNGAIDFAGEGRMGLSYDFPGGRVEDFLRVLSSLTDELPGFPSSLRGRLRSRGTIGGTLALNGMDIQAQAEGADLQLLGERVRAVKFKGGFQKGRYWADDMVLIKRSGSLVGRISYDQDRTFSWNFRSQNLSLRDLDWIIRADVPVAGDLSLQTEASGKWEALDSKTFLRATRSGIRGRPLPDSELLVQSTRGVFKARGEGLGGQLRLQLNHDSHPDAGNLLRLSLEGFDFSGLQILLNPSLAQDDQLAATVSGELDLSYKGTALEAASGRAELRGFGIRKSGTAFRLESPVSCRIERGTFEMPELRIVSSDRAAVARLRLAAQGGSWRTRVGGELDLSVLEFLTQAVSQAKGVAELDFLLKGEVGAPSFSGRADIRDGSIRIPGLDSPVDNLSGRVSASQNRWSFTAFQADLAQGRLTGSGQMLLFADRLPELDFVANVAENRLKAYPFQLLKVRSGRVRLSGSRFPYEISGNIVVDQAISREKLANAGQGIALKSTLYAPTASTEGNLDFPKFDLKVDVSADGGLRFQNELLDVEMKAQIQLVNTIDAPRILGKAEMVPGSGRLSFKEHVFQFQSAVIVFDNPTVINPRFDVGATTEVSGTKIQLYASGTADRYKIDLSSNPVMPESEILSLLAVGRTSQESQRLRSGNVSGVLQSEAASLILNSMDFNRDVKEKTGFQIGVGEAMDTSSGSSIFRKQAETESAVAPKIVLKRQIGKRMDFSVGSTVGAGSTSQKEVNADFYLSPSVSVRGVWNYLEGTTTQDAGASQQGRTSYGLDLKLQKRFK